MLRNKDIFGTAVEYVRSKCLEVQGPLDTPCWIWQHGLLVGYGRAVWEGQACYAHRLVFIEVNGQMPEDKPCVCHACDIRACCNPEHLFAGSHKDNAQDREDKGRGNRVKDSAGRFQKSM